LLAKLIHQRDATMPIDMAAHLAEALAKFLDEAQINRCDFSKLPTLVADHELAKHWQDTVEFLSILTEHWPAILQAEGCLDPATRRNRVLAAQIAIWQKNPPPTQLSPPVRPAACRARRSFSTLSLTCRMAPLFSPA